MENVANKIAMDYAFAVIESYLEQNPNYSSHVQSVTAGRVHLPDCTGFTIRAEFLPEYVEADNNPHCSVVAEFLLYNDKAPSLKFTTAFAEAIDYNVPAHTMGQVDTLSARSVLQMSRALLYAVLHPHILPYLTRYTGYGFAFDAGYDQFKLINYISEYGSTYQGVGLDIIAALAHRSVNEHWDNVVHMFSDDADEDERPVKRRPSPRRQQQDCDC